MKASCGLASPFSCFFFAFCFSKIVIGRSRFAVCRMCSELFNVLRKRAVVYSRRFLVFFVAFVFVCCKNVLLLEVISLRYFKRFGIIFFGKRNVVLFRRLIMFALSRLFK